MSGAGFGRVDRAFSGGGVGGVGGIDGEGVEHLRLPLQSELFPPRALPPWCSQSVGITFRLSRGVILCPSTSLFRGDERLSIELLLSSRLSFPPLQSCDSVERLPRDENECPGERDFAPGDDRLSCSLRSANLTKIRVKSVKICARDSVNRHAACAGSKLDRNGLCEMCSKEFYHNSAPGSQPFVHYPKVAPFGHQDEKMSNFVPCCSVLSGSFARGEMYVVSYTAC